MILKKVVNCARCDGTHENLEAKELERPMDPGIVNYDGSTMVWTHWAKCPTNGDPIMVMVTE